MNYKDALKMYREGHLSVGELVSILEQTIHDHEEYLRILHESADVGRQAADRKHKKYLDQASRWQAASAKALEHATGMRDRVMACVENADLISRAKQDADYEAGAMDAYSLMVDAIAAKLAKE